MKLIQKLNLISILFILSSSIAIILILRSTSISNYGEVEYQVHKTAMTNYYKIVSQHFEQLDYVLWDWSEWDATYDYIEGNYDDYIDDNLPTASYDDFGLDYIAIYDENYDIIYGNQFNEDDYSLIPLDPSLSEAFVEAGEVTGILLHEDHLLLYSGKAITDNEGEKPYKGLMVFAYELDDNVREDLIASIGTDITVKYLDQDPGSAQGFDNQTPDEENPYHLVVTLSHDINEDGIGRIDIPYLNSQGALRLEFNLGQAIQTLGRRHIQTTLVLILTTLVFFSALMALALRGMVIDRVSRLNMQVNSITSSKDVKGRVKLPGLDELGELSEGINAMLIEIDKVHEEANWYANHDEMTGAYNRRAGFKLIENILEGFSEDNQKLTLAYVDIDGLKKVNDTHGHLEGDRLITDMVSLMNETLGDHCHIVRIGGDEFIIACGNQNESATLNKLKELEESVSSFNQNHSRVYNVSFSYGLATYHKGMAVDDIIEEADQQMYQNRKRKRQN